MTPEDFTTDLSAILRSQGVAFNRADLEAFAADVRRQPATDRNMEALAERFQEAQAAAVRSLERKRAGVWWEGMSIAGIGVVFLGFAALFGFAIFLILGNDTPPSSEGLLIVGGIAVGGFLLGAGLVAIGVMRAALGSHRLSAAIYQARDSDAAS